MRSEVRVDTSIKSHKCGICGSKDKSVDWYGNTSAIICGSSSCNEEMNSRYQACLDEMDEQFKIEQEMMNE